MITAQFLLYTVGSCCFVVGSLIGLFLQLSKGG